MATAPKKLKQIPVADPGASYRAHRAAIDRAVAAALESGWYILGGETARFEEQFAKYLGVSHCIGVANGTDALVVALRAAGVAPGDEVVTVSHSAVATVAAVELAGAVPVFVDIEPETRCMDPARLADACSPKTKAVVPVHIYGQPARIEEIAAFARERGMLVIEDCAQAHGAKVGDDRVGTFGDAAAFSFYPTKNLGAFGDGGAVVTNSGKIAEAARMIRQYGWRERYVSEIAGMNSRLDELHAAMLIVKLAALDSENERRRKIAERYREALAGTPVRPPRAVAGTTPAMHLFVVECEDRDGFRAHMDRHGVQTALHYPQAIHQQPAYRGRLRGCEELPATEALYARIVSLPLFPELEEEQIARVCEALRSYR